MRQVVVCGSPASITNERNDQWVASADAAVSVRSITSATFSSSMVRRHRGRVRSPKVTAGSRNPASRDLQLGGQAALPVSE